jgi:hypothetical protein
MSAKPALSSGDAAAEGGLGAAADEEEEGVEIEGGEVEGVEDEGGEDEGGEVEGGEDEGEEATTTLLTCPVWPAAGTAAATRAL